MSEQEGLLSEGVGTNHGLLFQIEIPIVDHRTCQEAYAPLKKKVTRDMICAGEKEGKSRDSVQQGTTSHGRGVTVWRSQRTGRRMVKRGRNPLGDSPVSEKRGPKNSRHSLLQAQVFPYERRVPNQPSLSEISEL